MKIGIIGGSGLDNPEILKDFKEINVETPYGKPSSAITSGKIGENEVFIIARHGKRHQITPTNVNNRANIYALGKLGCRHIIATSAAGSLREDIEPENFVVPNQLIDFTKFRKTSFYDSFEKEVEHVSLADPFSKMLREKIIEGCKKLGFNFHENGTTVTIEGNRFSTRAESDMFRMLGGDVIGMTTAPEAALSREAGIEYAVICMVTDYDCWKKGEEDVSIEMVFKRMKDNAERVKMLIMEVVRSLNG